MSDKRCVTCGKSDHLNAACKYPGGQQDPNYKASWDEYRTRRDEAKAAGKGTTEIKTKVLGKEKGKKERTEKERQKEREMTQRAKAKKAKAKAKVKKKVPKQLQELWQMQE